MKIKVGFFGRPHGIHGSLHLNVFPETGWEPKPHARLYCRHQGSEHALTIAQVHSKATDYIVGLDTVHTRTDAQSLTNKPVWAEIIGLPPKTFLIKDLIGLHVVRVNGSVLGTVHDIVPNPGHDIIQVNTVHGELLIPAHSSIIKEVNIPKQELVVHLPDGFEDAAGFKRP
ncbi:MAG: 16S rRNA processing protein RimM [Elusimicrobia bacterium]|nr:16S rRNA processing protein RimM [Elusimicrobiota bacterium]MBD3412663.1 16S rRNA processing protein RimM [Elusimicrobiota bacterium]